MLNVLFTFTAQAPLAPEKLNALSAAGAVWTEVPECKPGTYQAYVPDYPVLQELFVLLQIEGLVLVIGVWDEAGNQLVFQALSDLFRFFPQRYLDALLDEITYNPDGTELSRTRPTQLKQVNIFAGFADGRGRSLAIPAG